MDFGHPHLLPPFDQQAPFIQQPHQGQIQAMPPPAPMYVRVGQQMMMVQQPFLPHAPLSLAEPQLRQEDFYVVNANGHIVMAHPFQPPTQQRAPILTTAPPELLPNFDQTIHHPNPAYSSLLIEADKMQPPMLRSVEVPAEFPMPGLHRNERAGALQQELFVETQSTSLKKASMKRRHSVQEEDSDDFLSPPLFTPSESEQDESGAAKIPKIEEPSVEFPPEEGEEEEGGDCDHDDGESVEMNLTITKTFSITKKARLRKNCLTFKMDGCDTVYFNGYLYSKKKQRNDGSSLLYCLDRTKHSCYAVGEMRPDGVVIIKRDHIGHDKDVMDSALRLAKRETRLESKDNFNDTLTGILGEMDDSGMGLQAPPTQLAIGE